MPFFYSIYLGETTDRPWKNENVTGISLKCHRHLVKKMGVLWVLRLKIPCIFLERYFS